MSLPSDILNLILEYYSQLRDMKWTPFIDDTTGKLIWKVNKYSAKYDNINKLLDYRKYALIHAIHDIQLDIELIHNRNEIDLYYSELGTIKYLKTYHPVNKYQMIIPTSYVYIEYCIEDSNYSLFCSLRNNITNLGYKNTHDVDVYQDNNIYAKVNELRRLGTDAFHLTIEKY